jgi:hypothetical protein
MRIAFLLAAATALLAACSSGNSGNDVSGLSPTWTNVYSAVVAKRCLPCHATSTGVSLGKLDLSSKDKAYANLLNVAAQGSACAGQGTLVVPGQAGSSLLYQKVGSSPPCGLTMPFQVAPLSGSEKSLIKDWINGGATNN